jgi:deoxyhypusine synthase
MEKSEYLKDRIQHIDIKSFDATPIIESMANMSFSSRETARAAEICDRMIKDPEATVILTLAGSTTAGGCQQIYVDMIRSRMVDVIVATGAAIVDMDFFEGIGFNH